MNRSISSRSLPAKDTEDATAAMHQLRQGLETLGLAFRLKAKVLPIDACTAVTRAMTTLLSMIRFDQPKDAHEWVVVRECRGAPNKDGWIELHHAVALPYWIRKTDLDHLNAFEYLLDDLDVETDLPHAPS